METNKQTNNKQNETSEKNEMKWNLKKKTIDEEKKHRTKQTNDE